MNEHLIRNIFKIIISFLLYYSGISFFILKLFLKKGLYIFNYHCFNTFTNDYWKFGSIFSSNYEDNFERQIIFFNKYLKKIENFNLKDNTYKNPIYFLTFDDGYKDNFNVAFPILKKYSIPTIFFITTSVVGSDSLLWHDRVKQYYENKERKNIMSSISLKRKCKKRLNELKQMKNDEFISNLNKIMKFQSNGLRMMMNWSELKQSYKQGIMIGSHTHTHPILAKLDFNQQKEEIESSLQMIEKKLEYIPIFFSYPGGSKESYDKDTINILRECGIKYSFTACHGINNKFTSPYHLKRIGINPSDPIPILAIKIIREMTV